MLTIKKRLPILLVALLSMQSFAFADSAPVTAKLDNGTVKECYVVGQPLQTDLTYTVTYADTTTASLLVTSDMFWNNPGGIKGAQVNTESPMVGDVSIMFGEDSICYIPNFIVESREDAVNGLNLDLDKQGFIFGDDITITGNMRLSYKNGWEENVKLDNPLVTIDLGVDVSKVGYHVISVSALDHTLAPTITVVERTATVLDVISQRLEYVKGEALTDKGSVLVTYNNGTSKLVDLTSEMMSGYDADTLGEQIITVTCEGLKTTFPITVVAETTPAPVTMTDIVIEGTNKTEYFVDDQLGTVTVKEVYSNGSETTGVEGVTVEGFDSSVATNSQVLTVKHAGFTKTFEVSIKEDNITKIETEEVQFDMSYETGELIGTPTVRATYESGISKDVPIIKENILFDEHIEKVLGLSKAVINIDGKNLNTFINYVTDRSVDDIVSVNLNHEITAIVGHTDHVNGVIELTYNGGAIKKAWLADFANSIVWEHVGPALVGEVIPFKVTFEHNLGVQFAEFVVTAEPNVLTIVGYEGNSEFTVGDVVGNRVKVLATLNGETIKYELDNPLLHITGLDIDTIGTRIATITISGADGFVEVPYTVIGRDNTEKPTVEPKLEWTNKAPQTKYTVGDEINSGTPVRYTDAEGHVTTKTIADCTVTGFDTTAAGTKEVTVSLNNISITYTINVTEETPEVVERTVTKIALQGDTREFKVGDKYDNKGKLTVTYSDNTTEVKTGGEFTVTGFNSTKAGDNELTVSYGGMKLTFTVKINAVTPPAKNTGNGGGGSGGSVTTKPAVTPIDTVKPVVIENKSIERIAEVTKETIATLNSFTISSTLLGDLKVPERIQVIDIVGKVIDFKDTKTHWANSTIEEVVGRGLLNGVTEDTFAPKANLTLEQTLVGINNVMLKNNMIEMKMQREIVEGKLQNIMATPTWSTFAVAQVLGNTDEAMLNKVSEDKTVLQKDMTRNEMAEMLFNVLGGTISNEADNAQNFCRELGFMVGDADGNFAGERVLSRAELASILLRVDNKLALVQ